MLNKENIEIISELNYASSKSGAFVFTFLGLIKDVDPDEIEYSIDEVSEVFFVPLSFFLENRPEKYYMNYYPKADKDFPYHMVNNGEDYNWGNIRYPCLLYTSILLHLKPPVLQLYIPCLRQCLFTRI